MRKGAAISSIWPETATADELGVLIGLSGRRVRELGAGGTFPKAPGGRYVVIASVAAYVASLRTAAKAKPATVDPAVAAAVLDGRLQRARLARATADLKVLELERESGRLVDAEALGLHYVGLVTALRNRLLAVPSEAKSEIPHLTVDEIEVLEELVRGALVEVAEGADEEGDDDES